MMTNTTEHPIINLPVFEYLFDGIMSSENNTLMTVNWLYEFKHFSTQIF